MWPYILNWVPPLTTSTCTKLFAAWEGFAFALTRYRPLIPGSDPALLLPGYLLISQLCGYRLYGYILNCANIVIREQDAGCFAYLCVSRIYCRRLEAFGEKGGSILEGLAVREGIPRVTTFCDQDSVPISSITEQYVLTWLLEPSALSS